MYLLKKQIKLLNLLWIMPIIFYIWYSIVKNNFIFEREFPWMIGCIIEGTILLIICLKLFFKKNELISNWDFMIMFYAPIPILGIKIFLSILSGPLIKWMGWNYYAIDFY